MQYNIIKNKNFAKKRLSLLLGARGVGKTTTLIQYLLKQVNADILNNSILYVQTDHFDMNR